MCGILFTNLLLKNIDHILHFLKKRGPDKINIYKQNEFTFIHTLLSMTGEITCQPFVDEEAGIVAMFNGEIYNYNDFDNYSSDGYCLIPLYKKYGEQFISKLDGEFCILLYDSKKDLLIVSTDIFSTKPIWLAVGEHDIGASSYYSCLERLGHKNIMQIPSNTTLLIDLKNRKLIKKLPVHIFDLTQKKNNFNDIRKTLEKAVEKRINGAKHGIFIGLSSGYDSGTIACILRKMKVPFTAYSILGIDDKNVIMDRHKLLSDTYLLDLTSEQFMGHRDHLINNCEPYVLEIDSNENNRFEECLKTKTPKTKKICDRMFNIAKDRNTSQQLTNDNGSIGISYICKLAREKGQLIYLSGSGADEIFSDYGYDGIKFYSHSTIGGYFPDDLSKIFPWKNFFSNTQRAYLMKEEYVTGSYGVEGRYPFLDKDVVQEFLWLNSDLKNKYYKAPLHDYLMTNGFPFIENLKVGFNCGFHGPENNYAKRDIEKCNTNVKTAVRPNLIIDKNNMVKEPKEGIAYLDPKNMKYLGGNCYECQIYTRNSLGEIFGDSEYFLYEDNKRLNRKSTKLEDIKKLGSGRYYHDTSTKIYFSTQDNSDPRTNGKYYRLKLGF